MWDSWELWEVIEAIELVAELAESDQESTGDPTGSWLASLVAAKG